MTDSLKAYFISDLHLASDSEANFILFRDWLHQLTLENPTHLFLLGDVFDLWVGDYDYFKIKFREIIDVLAELKSKGTEIHFFEGNHDLYLKSFWEGELGIYVHSDPIEIKLATWNVWLEHGDQIDKDDTGYIFLRGFLRSYFVKQLINNLPESLVVFLGEKASRGSRKYTSQIKTISEVKTLNKIHEHVIKIANDKKVDFLISGHLHVRDEFKFVSNNRNCISINLGTWLKEPYVYRIDKQGGSWIKID